MKQPKSNLYRPNVGIMLLNANNEVFVAQRIDVKTEAWQMPQGGIDDGEQLFDAVLRELKEEIGTNNVSLVAEHEDWLFYDFPQALQQKLWGGKYKGQRQKWFLLRFLGDDSDINIETAIPEFLAWKWVTMTMLPDLAIDFKKDIYQQLVKAFLPLL
jgi:putative (di)nucleoside polyphosphate hydrolase